MTWPSIDLDSSLAIVWANNKKYFQSRPHCLFLLTTSALVAFGDSLVDAKNRFTLISLVGQNPFEANNYSGGGNTKASDGLVLGEQIAGELRGLIDDMQNTSIVFSCLIY